MPRWVWIGAIAALAWGITAYLIGALLVCEIATTVALKVVHGKGKQTPDQEWRAKASKGSRHPTKNGAAAHYHFKVDIKVGIKLVTSWMPLAGCPL